MRLSVTVTEVDGWAISILLYREQYGHGEETGIGEVRAAAQPREDGEEAGQGWGGASASVAA
jgi:hypothetical protein